jgi:phosphatidylglycerol:prolipoprotein diacylglycerol transferase
MIPSPSISSIPVGPVTIHFYGLIIGLAFVLCYSILQRQTKRQEISPDLLEKMFLICLVAAIIGARAYHVITNWQYYSQFPTQIISIWNGGLGIIGGIATVVLTIYFLSKKYSKPFLQITDLFALVLPLGQAIGRWGNYFNQELYGKPTSLPWGLQIDVEHRIKGYEQFQTFHPTFLYESILNFINFAVLYYLYTKKNIKPGTVTSLYLVFYGIIRLFIESIKLDPDVSAQIGPLRVPQYLSIILIIIGLVLVRKKYGRISRQNK